MISRAYYGAFQIAEAVIAAKNYPIENVKDHGVTWKALKAHGTEDEKIAADLGAGLMRARKKADYDNEIEGNLEELSNAAVKKAKEICKKLGYPVTPIKEVPVAAGGTATPADPAPTPTQDAGAGDDS